MKTSIQNLRSQEQGFTLVELAVVMIIIGLLIGGILKGQELITNARVTTSISQMEALGAAYNGFIDQFNVQPGDMVTADTRLTNCAAQCIGPAATAGNGIINTSIGVVPAGEGLAFFGQLLAAGFITGLDGTNVVAFGNALPTAPVGGGFTVGDARNGAATGFNITEMRPRPHIVLTGTTAAVGTGTGILTPAQAANLDRRLDDGVPGTGSVISQNTGSTCRNGIVYAQSVTNQTCAVAYRL